MTYLAINTVPLARDYGFIVDVFDEMFTKLELMNPDCQHGVRKHFILLKINKSVDECRKDFGGFLTDISGNIISRQAKVNLEAIGLSADSLIKIKDIKTEVFLPPNPEDEITLKASDVVREF